MYLLVFLGPHAAAAGTTAAGIAAEVLQLQRAYAAELEALLGTFPGSPAALLEVSPVAQPVEVSVQVQIIDGAAPQPRVELAAEAPGAPDASAEAAEQSSSTPCWVACFATQSPPKDDAKCARTVLEYLGTCNRQDPACAEMHALNDPKALAAALLEVDTAMDLPIVDGIAHGLWVFGGAMFSHTWTSACGGRSKDLLTVNQQTKRADSSMTGDILCVIDGKACGQADLNSPSWAAPASNDGVYMVRCDRSTGFKKQWIWISKPTKGPTDLQGIKYNEFVCAEQKDDGTKPWKCGGKYRNTPWKKACD